MSETCPTCGAPVRVVSSDEGTSHYTPIPRAPAMDDDEVRAQLEENDRLVAAWRAREAELRARLAEADAKFYRGLGLIREVARRMEEA